MERFSRSALEGGDYLIERKNCLLKKLSLLFLFFCLLNSFSRPAEADLTDIAAWFLLGGAVRTFELKGDGYREEGIEGVVGLDLYHFLHRVAGWGR